ncbi:MAG: outer membrane biosynthesis protein TonB [Bermanella sp.]|jgi:outer membrane biosynthesis protein TonB|uniref:AgmX/PglI C-terminal domain-containing protein n=1 Tax=Glaciecola sp. 33A TaxID=2057807 RepID=UPI0012FEFD74|nr:AgmX/PglI C-terminal domain-containing protein [Glaciecola sp. 33A]
MSTSNLSSAYFHSLLPWESSDKENSTFTGITIVLLALTLAIAFYVQITELPEVPRAERDKLPPQLAKLIKAKEPAPPKVIEPEPKPEPEPEKPKPEPEKPKPAPKPEPKPEPKPKPTEPTLEEKTKQARESAKSKGVLALQDQLASMRDTANLANLANTQQTQGGGQTDTSQRKILGRETNKTSGGIKLGSLSSDVGAAGELEERRNTEFVGAEIGKASLATQQRLEETQDVIGSRDLDSIRQILDANKGAVYSLYRRALRQDPSIEGKLTVRLTIQPDGSLLSVRLVNSELGAPELVEKLISRIRLINFGTQNVTATELEYAFNFLPF